MAVYMLKWKEAERIKETPVVFPVNSKILDTRLVRNVRLRGRVLPVALEVKYVYPHKYRGDSYVLRERIRHIPLPIETISATLETFP